MIQLYLKGGYRSLYLFLEFQSYLYIWDMFRWTFGGRMNKKVQDWRLHQWLCLNGEKCA